MNKNDSNKMTKNIISFKKFLKNCKIFQNRMCHMKKQKKKKKKTQAKPKQKNMIFLF